MEMYLRQGGREEGKWSFSGQSVDKQDYNGNWYSKK
jgi:hypothetical protein